MGMSLSRTAWWIISACAEQTVTVEKQGKPRWEHLRVCGADLRDGTHRVLKTGSSPRVRSRRGGNLVWGCRFGIISACAEQTSTYTEPPGMSADHLRVCGADEERRNLRFCNVGSSPRVRSRPGRERVPARRPGIISACAEQT